MITASPNSSATAATSAVAPVERIAARTNVRWVICALLFFAATINYVDRQVLSVLKPTLQKELGWEETDYSNIVFYFQFAYAIGLLCAGRIMDWLGTRRGFAMSVVVWSLAAVGHFFAKGVAGFGIARFALGLGEAGNFPASIKTVAEWFPKRERALATGIFNSGTNIGVVVTAPIVAWITLHWGWRWAFVITGSLGFIWLALWLILYSKPENHERVSAAELEYIRSDPTESHAKVSWFSLLTFRQTWAVVVGKFLTDPIWYLYLFWIPDFLTKQHHIDLKTMAPPLVTIYLISDVGSVAGGWLSSALIRHGWSINAARKTAMLVCALCVVPIIWAPSVSNVWAAVAIIGLAAAAHQGWSANIFTLMSDMYPRRAVGSVVGIAGMAGAIGGMILSKRVGSILQATGSYVTIFLVAGSAYLIALAIIHCIVPRLTPAVLAEEDERQETA